MTVYRLDNITTLARQMNFASHGVRLDQIVAAERLLLELDPDKGYPWDYVLFRITGYRPKSGGDEFLSGEALLNDLGILVETLSDGLNLHVANSPEPVLTIDEVSKRFDVTSKTLQRWRRRGLPARRFIFPDAKKRVGFLLNLVEQYIQSHGIESAPQAQEKPADLFVLARKLIARGFTIDLLPQRLARKTGQTPLGAFHRLVQYDQQHPEDPILSADADPLTAEQSQEVLNLRQEGLGLTEIAQRLSRSRKQVYAVLLRKRAEAIANEKTSFFDDPLYHHPDAEQTLESLVRQNALDEPGKREPEFKLTGPVADLCREAPLNPALERALFLKLNYHKYRFSVLKTEVDPLIADHRELDAMQRELDQAHEVRKRIVLSNLRLAVSVAKKHLRPGLDMMELLSEGHLTLIRAADAFNPNHGVRFGTYATLALMKDYAHSAGKMISDKHSGMDIDLIGATQGKADHRLDEIAAKDQVQRLMTKLNPREREILSMRYGLDGAKEEDTYQSLSGRLGISKERVRQIEQDALRKMRG